MALRAEMASKEPAVPREAARPEKRKITRGVATEKRFDFVAASHCVGVAKRQQLAAVLAVEQQIRQQIGAGALGRPQTAQEVSHTGRQTIGMANRELTQVAARAHDQRVKANEFGMRFLDCAGNEIEHLIDSLQALQIRAQVVEKDAGKRVARDSGQSEG